jgi:hypothetical protein
VKPSYSNVQEKTRKTEVGASEPRSLREQQEYWNGGMVEEWKNQKTEVRASDAGSWMLANLAEHALGPQRTVPSVNSPHEVLLSKTSVS